MDVNHRTLQHAKYPNIFALGDCAGLPVSKTASAVAGQTSYLVANLVGQISADRKSNSAPGKSPAGTGAAQAMYDGYTSCPLVTGDNKMILAEFDGFTLSPRETFFFDQAKERSSMYSLKSEVRHPRSQSVCVFAHSFAQILPRIYWEWMMRGKWSGPAPYRPFLNPLNRN